MTDKGYADEKVLALTLLARTTSNLKSTLLLLDNRRVIEARVITRCCLENSFWVGCLIEDGVKFTREMLGDEMHHRLKRGQSLFASALPLGDEVELRLREWMRTHAKQFESARRLNPKDVDPNGALDAKTKELIGLGVAAQIPCGYCVYYHTQAAKHLGATDAQIKEAVAAASMTRKWSTELNGNQYDMSAFKKQVDAAFGAPSQ